LRTSSVLCYICVSLSFFLLSRFIFPPPLLRVPPPRLVCVSPGLIVLGSFFPVIAAYVSPVRLLCPFSLLLFPPPVGSSRLPGGTKVQSSSLCLTALSLSFAGPPSFQRLFFLTPCLAHSPLWESPRLHPVSLSFGHDNFFGATLRPILRYLFNLNHGPLIFGCFFVMLKTFIFSIFLDPTPTHFSSRSFAQPIVLSLPGPQRYLSTGNGFLTLWAGARILPTVPSFSPIQFSLAICRSLPLLVWS